MLVGDHVFPSNLERLIILYTARNIHDSECFQPDHSAECFLMTQDTACALQRFAASCKRVSQRSLWRSRKKTHTFFVLLEGGQYTVESYCPSAMQNFGKVACESLFKWSFCWSWHVTRSNTNAKYVLNREECESKKKHQSSKSLEQRLRWFGKKIPLPKGVSFWCFTHFETAEISVKTMGGEVPQKQRFRGNILMNHIRWSTYLAPPEQVLVR